jgi:hypothetical protein
MQSDRLIKNYCKDLHAIPELRGGCHTTLLTVANLYIIIGRPENEVFTDIRLHEKYFAMLHNSPTPGEGE